MTCWEDRKKPACRGNAPENLILLGSFPNSRFMAVRHTGDKVAAMQVMAVVTVIVTLVLRGTA